MLVDSLKLLEGAEIDNATIASGTSFPSNPSTGELFFRTDLSELHVYDGSSWVAVGSSGATPGGSNGQFQFNDSGSLGGASLLAWDNSNSKILIGSGSSRTIGSVVSVLQVEGTSTANGSISITNTNASAAGARITLAKARGGALGSVTIVQSGDALGVLSFAGADGVDVDSEGARISAEVDGTPGSNDLPTRLVFYTTADGSASVTEQFRISNAGAWGISGANFGTSGQVLTSNGSGSAPQWANVGSVTSINVSGGTTGLTTSGGPITSSGTITLSGTLVAANGGTGFASYTVGDILYADTTSSLAKLSAGTSGKVLTSNGAGSAPSWQTAPSTTPSLTATYIGYGSGSNLLTGTSDFTWSDSTQTLTFGTSSTGPSLVATVGATNGQSMAITGSDASGTAHNGGALTIRAGNATTSGTGGTLNLFAGTTASGTPGDVFIGTGVGGSGSANDGRVLIGSSNGNAQLIIHRSPLPTFTSIVLQSYLDNGNNLIDFVIQGTDNAGIGSTSGNITVAGGSGVNGSSGTSGGNVTVAGGTPSAASGTGGNVTVKGGPGGTSSGNAGHVTIAGGTVTSGTAGYVSVETSGVERLRILRTGDWSVGSAGTNVGTSGQVLMSNGSGSAPAWSSVATALGYTPLKNTTDTFTGTLTISGGTVTGLSSPSATSDAATKAYVDAIANGLTWKNSVKAATTANLNATYAGSPTFTLTNAGTQTAFSVDGYSASAGDRILVKNQSTASRNGIYTVTTVGSGSTNWVLTRTSDFNEVTPIDEVNGAAVYIQQGTTQANEQWTVTSVVSTFDTDAITWTQFAGTSTGVSSFSAGSTGLTPNSTTTGAVTLGGTLNVGNGGTGLATTPTDGQLLIGKTSTNNYSLATLTQGTGITITNGSGSITIANAGVTSLSGTANQITASGSTGSVTLSLPSSVILPGSLTLQNTGSGYLYASTNTVAAAGSSFNTATSIQGLMFAVVTSGTNGTAGVALGGNSAGTNIYILNRTASACVVYPQGTVSVDGLSAGTSFSIPANSAIRLQATSTTQYYTTVYPIAAGATSTTTGLSVSYGNGSLTLNGVAFTSSNQGMAPASGGGTSNFLRADGTWAVPPGSGGNASTTGGSGAIQFNSGGSFASDAGLVYVGSTTQTLTIGTSSTGPTINATAGSSAGVAMAINGSAATSGNGGSLTIKSGAAASTGSGGNLALTGGNGAGTGNGARVLIAGGTGGASSGAVGGDVQVGPGLSGISGSGTAGNAIFGNVTNTIGVLGSGQTSGYTLLTGMFSPGSAGVTLNGSTSNGPIGTTQPFAAQVYVAGGQSQNSSSAPGNVIVTGGTVVNLASSSSMTAGQVLVTGGFSQTPAASMNSTSAVSGGACTVSGGNGYANGTNVSGGNLVLQGGIGTINGAGTATGGYISLSTGNTALTERFRITAAGEWSVGSTGSDVGTSGQVLTSNGPGSAPTWQAASGGSGTSLGMVVAAKTNLMTVIF